MIRIEFIDKQPPTSPRRYAIVHHTRGDGTEHIRTGHGKDDLERLADAFAKLCMAVPRLRREWHRAENVAANALRRELHIERIRENVRAIQAANVASAERQVAA